MPIMSVDIPENLKEKIEEEIENGHYTSKSEVIRDALRRLICDIESSE